MAILYAMFFGLTGGVLSLILGALVGSPAADMFHITKVEAANGLFAGFVGALIAACGTIASIVATLRWRGVTGFWNLAGGSLATMMGFVAVGACCFGLFYVSVPHRIGDGRRVFLELQIALPRGADMPDLSKWEAQLNTINSRMSANWDDRAKETLNRRSVIKGNVELVYRDQGRQLALTLPGGDVHTFRVRLPANPVSDNDRNWSPWQKPDFSYGPAGAAPSKGTDYLIRYHVGK